MKQSNQLKINHSLKEACDKARKRVSKYSHTKKAKLLSDAHAIIDYPEITEGSILARKVREKCNKLTANQRKEYLKKGLDIIYSGSLP